MSCDINFCDYVNCQREGAYIVKTGLPDGLHTFTLTNKWRSYTFQKQVVDGEISIDIENLPDGYFNPYAGTYVLSVIGCYDYICETYTSITFEVRNGEGKYTIECPCAATS